jgi:ABC-type xylose transport system permease subunit
MQSSETKAMVLEVKKVQSAMLSIIAVQVFGMVYLLVTGELDLTMGVVMFAFTAVYVGLWAWCHRNPLAAAIVGLVVFVVVHLIEALIDPSALARGAVIIVALTAALGWAVTCGIKHRKLARERSEVSPI